MRADGSDSPSLQTGFFNRCKRRLRESFADQKVKLANFRHRTMETDPQDLLSQSRFECPMHVRHHSRPQPAFAPADFRNHRVDAIRGSS
jgi:hypothetical protein